MERSPQTHYPVYLSVQEMRLILSGLNLAIGQYRFLEKPNESVGCIELSSKIASEIRVINQLINEEANESE